MTRWLFAPEGPRRLAAMRIGLGLILLWDAGARWRYAVELYSSAGPAIPLFSGRITSIPGSDEVEPSSDAKGAVDRARGFHGPIPSPALAVSLHSLLLFALLAIVLGWHARLSLVTAFALISWLAPLDRTATLAKNTVMAQHLLLLLACSSCGKAWSLDARCDRRNGAACPLSPAWPRRMMQVLVCAIYFGAAMTKLRSPTFSTGDLLTFSLLDDHWGAGYWGVGRLGLWLSTFPRAILLLSVGTLWFELAFPLLIWVPRVRRPLLCAAFVLHSCMALLLSLGSFSPTMFVALMSYLEERDFPRAFVVGRRADVSPTAARGNRARWTSAMLFAAMALAAAWVGLAVQRECDWYGAFGRRPLKELLNFPEVPAAELAEMRAGREPAWEDLIHRVSLGSRTNGTQVFGSSTKFHVGERLYVLIQVLEPHPELRLEGLLIAPDGREAARFAHRLGRGYGYSVNGFELTGELPPGEYRLILQVEGFAFAERQIELVR